MSEGMPPTSEAVETEMPAAPAPIGDLSAGPGRYYRNTRYILAAGLIFYAVLSIRDGFIKWPAENARVLSDDPKLKPHTITDIRFNQVLGVGLPPMSLALVVFALYSSRGRIRLEGRTVYAPGHPPIPLERIESVDRAKWDRKGVALVRYHLDTGQAGVLKLDDFVYERDPIDRIFQQIENSLRDPKSPAAAPSPAAPVPAPARIPAAAPVAPKAAPSPMSVTPPPPFRGGAQPRPKINYPPPPPRPRL